MVSCMVQHISVSSGGTGKRDSKTDVFFFFTLFFDFLKFF